MAINWGSYNGHLRVGIDYSISPSNPSHSDTTVKVTWKFYLGTDGWNFSGDTSYMHENADGWGGTTKTFTNNLSSGHMLVDTHTETYSIDYNSGNKSANANLTGAYNGATPSNSRTISLPDRPVATPSAGEAIHTTSVGTTSADLAWDAPNDNGGSSVDQYQLQVSRSSGFSSRDIDYDSTFNGSGAGSRTATGLSPNTHYYARVRAHNSAGWGNWTSSTYCQFTTDGGTPSAPITPSRTNRTQTSITVSWNNVSSNGGGAITYDVECYSDATLTTLVSSATAITVSDYQFTGLTPNTEYWFRARAHNSFGYSGWSGTDAEFTKATTVYTDSGDYVTLVNNLAAAVGDKLVHLGAFIFRGTTNQFAASGTGTTYVDMHTEVEPCTQPDAPTYIGGGGNATIQINYPGTYQIEFAVALPSWSENRGWEGKIYVNGSENPASTHNGGGSVVWADLGNAHSSFRHLSITRRLVPGDTIGFSLFQSGSADETLNIGDGTDLSTYARVTMVGF